MPEVQARAELVACCGLYCAACRSYTKGKCKGCQQNSKASWCKVRSCCQGKGIATCADCTDNTNPRDCKKFNNFVAQLFGIVFNSDRAACIAQIRQLGIAGHAQAMSEKGLQTIRRRKD